MLEYLTISAQKLVTTASSTPQKIGMLVKAKCLVVFFTAFFIPKMPVFGIVSSKTHGLSNICIFDNIND